MYLRGYSTASLVIGFLHIGLWGWRWVAFQGPYRLGIISEAGLAAVAFLALGRVAQKTERTPRGMIRVGWSIFIIATLHAAALVLLHGSSLKTVNLVLVALAASLIFPRTSHYVAASLFVFGAWGATLVFVNLHQIEPWVIVWVTAFGLSGNIHIFILRLFGDQERLERRDRRLIRDKTRLVAELRTAMENVTTLQGLIPMCAHCKKVRNDGGYWEQVEVFINSQTGRQFTHGYCPECYAEARKELDAMKAGPGGPLQG